MRNFEEIMNQFEEGVVIELGGKVVVEDLYWNDNSIVKKTNDYGYDCEIPVDYDDMYEQLVADDDMEQLYCQIA